MPEQFDDKTHEATPHRREQARDDGHVARSQDLSSALLLVASLLILIYFGNGVAEFFADLSRFQLQLEPTWNANPSEFVAQSLPLLSGLATVLLPILGLMMLAAIVAQLGQVGFLFVPQKLALDWSRIDPIQGAQRLFSFASVVRLSFGLFKIAVVAGVALWVLAGKRDEILSMLNHDVQEIAVLFVELTLWTGLKIALSLALLAILEYGYQRWKYEQDLRMTTQEIREEFRNLQGNPEIISRRKAIQKRLALSRIGSAVAEADAVISNPTELAVAIKYDHETMPAPIVVAKGAGLVAQRIRRLALEHGVPIVERKELARILYRTVDIGKPIPNEQYAAMAEVLRYVYQLKGKSIPVPK